VFRISIGSLHPGPTSKGEKVSPPSTAPIVGKATIQLGVRVVSQRAPFVTDSPVVSRNGAYLSYVSWIL
jgi:hypothetical protein